MKVTGRGAIVVAIALTMAMMSARRQSRQRPHRPNRRLQTPPRRRPQPTDADTNSAGTRRADRTSRSSGTLPIDTARAEVTRFE